MPWHVESDNPECSGFAVVKDADDSVAGCHDIEAGAQAQVAALYAQEPNMSAMLCDGTPIHGVAIVEGIETGDLPRREFAPGSLTFAPTPLSFKWQKEEHGPAEGGAVTIGRIDDLWRDGALIRYRGVMDSAGEHGAEAERLIAGKFLRGVSILPDDIEAQDIELVFPEPNMQMDEEVEDEATGSPLNIAPRKVVIHAGRIRSLTLVAEPAFIEADVQLGESPYVAPMTRTEVEPGMDMVEVPVEMSSTTVTAAAYTITIPDIWPEAWFQEPADMPPFGALHITPQGRVYGLLAPNNVAHRGFRASGQRVTVPRNIDYSEFQNKPCIVAGADGGVYKIPAGNITFGCGHASPVDDRRADPTWAQEHYENSCSIAARVRVGENKHGTWVAGALLHDITAETVERMMACALSGDWQGGKLNAALLVPVEGFPKAAASVRVRDDAIVASSVPLAFEMPPPPMDYGYLFDLVASATGRGPRARFDEIAAQRFDELERERR